MAKIKVYDDSLKLNGVADVPTSYDGPKVWVFDYEITAGEVESIDVESELGQTLLQHFMQGDLCYCNVTDDDGHTYPMTPIQGYYRMISGELDGCALSCGFVFSDEITTLWTMQL